MELHFKNCPFCGSDEIYIRARYGEVKDYKSKGQYSNNYWIRIECDLCNCQTEEYSNGRSDTAENDWEGPGCKKAISAWNRRKK